MLEGSNEARLGRQSLQNFKVVVDERVSLIAKRYCFVYLLVGFRRKVKWTPKKVGFFNRFRLCALFPIPSGNQCVDYSFRVVTAVDIKTKLLGFINLYLTGILDAFLSLLT